MEKRLGRRKFIKDSIFFGVASTVGASGLKASGLFGHPGLPSGQSVISVVTGPEYGKNAAKAVELLGGMGKYVTKGAKVALLPNTQSRHPGTFTSPEILRSVIRMCKDAGAAQVDCVSWLMQKHWDGSGLGKVVEEEGAKLILVDMKNPDGFQTVPVPKGIALKETAIMKEFYNHDMLISLPITKDHAGNKFTGTLKNFMGVNSPMSNKTFHLDDSDPNAIEHLDQCIADLNTVIAPKLCVVDATEIITTNGPFGPGELKKPQTVVAGTDRVAVDAYCTTILGMKPTDIIMIRKAYEHGLGEIDLSKVKILEAKA